MAFTVTSETNGKRIPFHVRVVFRGDGYGLFRDGKHACVHNEEEPMVEFYDGRYPHDPVGGDLRGQFVSRYYLSTLTEHQTKPHALQGGGGLNLQGDAPDWSIDGPSFALAVAYAQGVVDGRGLVAPSKPVPMHDEGDEVRYRVRDGKAQAVYIRRDGIAVGCGETKDGPDAIATVARMASVNALDASGAELRKSKAMLEGWTPWWKTR